MNEDVEKSSVHIHSRADELIACLEGEIAKRDARIEAQESQIKILQSDANSWQSGYDEGRRMGAKHAAPVSEAKAQGDAWAPSVNDYDHSIHSNPDAREWADFFVATFPGLADKHDLMLGWFANAMMAMHDHLARKAQGVVMPERKQYHDYLSLYDKGEAIGHNNALSEVARLNAAPVQQVKCKTCDDNGMIGGPSFYAPDEGGEPCPDCCSPVQQVSVQDGPAKMQWPEIVALVNEVIGCEAHKYPCERGSIGHEMTGINFNSLARIIDRVRYAASPAAPAADAGLVAVEWAKDAEEWGPALNEAGWLFLSELNEDPQKSALIFNNTKGPLRAAIMKYAEIVAANAKDSSHD